MVETNSDYNTNVSKKSILTTGQIVENNDKTRIKKYNILEFCLYLHLFLYIENQKYTIYI